MIFSIVNDRYYYESTMFPYSASRKRYVLEEYPSRARGTPEYNPLYDAFQPITPPNFHRQFQDSHGSIYDDPCSHYLDNGQQQMNLATTNRQRQYLPSYQKNDGKFFWFLSLVRHKMHISRKRKVLFRRALRFFYRSISFI
jgi:hypothetical protein